MTNRLQFSSDIAKGMQYLHDRGVLHRDLKSNNVLIVKKNNGQLISKISDFGLSKFKGSIPAEDKSYFNMYCNLWAPETLYYYYLSTEKKIYLDEKTEVFNYGVILWEMLTLKEPKFCNPDGTEMSADDIINYVCNQKGHLPLPTTLECDKNELKDVTEFIQIIRDCFEHDPAKRPSFCDLVIRFEMFKDGPKHREFRYIFNIPDVNL